MNSPVKLPPLPPIPWAVLGGIANDCVSAEAIHEYATAYAAQAVRPYVTALERIASEEFISLGEGNVDVRPSLSERQACDLAVLTLRGLVDCGACCGSGRVVRDPDIGTDQECWVCDGQGTVSEHDDG